MRPFVAGLLIALSSCMMWTHSAIAEDAAPAKPKGPKAIYMVVSTFQVLKPDADFGSFFGFVEDSYPMDQWKHDYELSDEEKRRIIFYTYTPADPIGFMMETSPEVGSLMFNFIVRAVGDDQWKKIRDRLDIEDDWYTEPEEAAEETEKPNYSQPVEPSKVMPTLYYKVLISLNAFDKKGGNYEALTAAVDKEKGPHSWYRLDLGQAKLSFALYTAKPGVALRFVDQTARANGYFIVGAAAEVVKVSDWNIAAEKMGVTETPPYNMLEKKTD